ncbi:hypothetical protein [Cellulomonas wangsupingiae]|uniref:Uncharacterized protein n=1 Tax=Cellulomonas wangsupingiae TaxID=2968085 RepID=A0ABY5K433_9CELL|nr:hypothetical protein [Cellulomonas wangsupingiae]MCC2333967.1 hypothetical protein [Cellulomonas wangsupingiae]UUI65222.1 hypothetical protein NP075_00285 [Cellulomonas wangsupingiae]
MAPRGPLRTVELIDDDEPGGSGGAPSSGPASSTSPGPSASPRPYRRRIAVAVVVLLVLAVAVWSADPLTGSAMLLDGRLHVSHASGTVTSDARTDADLVRSVMNMLVVADLAPTEARSTVLG